VKPPRPIFASAILGLVLFAVAIARAGAATVTIDDSVAAQKQVIDGFGACINQNGDKEWYQKAYYDDLGCSIMRMDITPQFKSPWSDHAYNSPWFSNQPPLKIDDPASPGGPDRNYVRTYTGPDDYTREFGSYKAQIAVMGPDIDKNIAFFDYDKVAAQGAMAQAGLARKDQLGDFKLYGSMWSPAPWVKIANGQKWGNHAGNMPATGTPYPFVWGGNFAGGKLDTSDKPLAVFDDGNGPTSALTQFARCTAAFVKGFQDKFGVRYYAISIQNELNFPEFYNSCVYQTSDEYIAALKAVREEFDRYPDLKGIQLIGPEDLLGGDPYSMWQFGGGADVTHKNLQYVTNVAKDPEAAAAESFFCIHGYATDGATAVGADSRQWRWWAEGWQESPAPGIPGSVPGFTSYHKKSWMTETSGEAPVWLQPATGYPGNGAWSIAFKMQQALTAGQESACLYWQFAERDDQTTIQCLTRGKDTTQEPKYVAAKHFIKFIRPGAVAVQAKVDGTMGVTGSAFLQKDNHTLTIVLVNKSPDPEETSVQLPDDFASVKSVDAVVSSDGSLWKESTASPDAGQIKLTVPGYGVVTLNAKGS
jgi:O-glycosyl hydrolase